MKKFALLLLFVSQFIHAEIVGIPAVVPTDWLVQNYVPGSVVLWFTGSSCAGGSLVLPANATPSDHARLYATIMSAKISGAKIFVYYDNTDACKITSFGFA
jgi:hypothetical protein